MADQKPEIKLSAASTRNYGKVSQTFGCEMTFTVTPTFSVHSGYSILMDQISAQFEDYESNVLPKVTFATIEHSATIPSVEKFHGVSIIMTKKGSKVFFAIKTREAAFAQHGVAVYPEVMDNYPMLKNVAIEKGEYVFKEPLIITVDKSTNHRKVVHIEGAQ